MNFYKENNTIKIINSFCSWIDLLGYGQPFYDCNWDLHNTIALQNIARLHNIEPIITSISSPYLETLFTLNDGYIRNFDIPCSDACLIMQWLIDVIQNFHLINKMDKENGFYGARGVITYGNRAIYREIDYLGRGDFILTSSERKQEYNKKNVVYTPNELQMNTAFSKAYIIENSGSKSGLKNNKIHIDEHMLEKFVDIINEIKIDTFGVTDDDIAKHGPCQYIYIYI